MCDQRGHANFDKGNDTVANDINTEDVTIIDDHCFEKGKFNELNNWKTNNVY